MEAVIVEGEGAVLRVNLGRPVETKWDLVAQLCKRDAIFPNYFGEDLYLYLSRTDSCREC